MAREERDTGVHDLSDIEVDEVSLVDRPATGRRFVLFKRGGPLRWPRPPAEGEEANKCSCRGVAELRKRSDAFDEEIGRLRDTASRLAERLEALEAAAPARQSGEATPRRESLWAGLL